MKLRLSSLILALAFSLLTPEGTSAQTQVAFQVFQSIPGVSMLPSAGAAVCFSSTSNTRFTDGSGRTSFEGIPPGTWAAHVWKSGFKSRRIDVTVPGGATVLPVVVQLSEKSSEAPPCVVPRLGEEKFPVRGKAPLTSSGGERTLDCHQFSQSHVMTGITGRHGEAINRMRLVCVKMSGGTLASLLQFSDEWQILGDGGNAFGRHCPTGQVVSAMQVTVHPESGQIRSASIQCRKIAENGLTTGAAVTLAPMGIPTTKSLSMDTCNGGRPARAIRAGADAFTPTISGIFAPWIIATTQLICEQPMP